MMKMKSKFLTLIVFVISSFLCINNVQAVNSYKATVKYVSGSSCNLYSGKSTGFCYYKDKNLNSYVPSVIWLDAGDEVTVYPDNKVPTNNKNICSTEYVYTDFYFAKKNTTYSGYYCSANLINGNDQLTEELKQEFKNAGFPESYWEKLAVLKKSHPSWTFRAIKTGLDWNTAINAESAVGLNLIEGSEEGYRSTLGGSYDYNTDKFKVFESNRWYAVDRAVVAYYMDPRNFLKDETIFQFESLESNSSIQTLDGVKSVLGNNYLNAHANDFINAAQISGVSSIYLAALALQEVGAGGTAVNGKGFTYDTRNSKYAALRGKWVDGSYYNVYNIGAGTDVVPSQNSVVYARGGVNGTDTSYGRPWNSMAKAITGGAQFIGESYITKGQNTIYLKKFNVASNYWDKYGHQYQSNIRAASTEGTTVYRSYHNLGILDSSFVFSIPVFENMPASTSMPHPGNPNNYLKDLKVGTSTVSGFKGSNTNYTVYVANSVSNVDITATTVNSKAKVSNLGNKNLAVGDNKFSVVVKAENEVTRTYSLNIVRSANQAGEPTVDDIVNNSGIKSDGTYFSGINPVTKIKGLNNKIKSLNANANVVIKSSAGKIKNIANDIFGTGDTVSITSAGETKTYIVVVYGDTTGDGYVKVNDLLGVQKHILGITKLKGAYERAADSSRDGHIKSNDLLIIQKHILNIETIKQ